MISWHAAGRGHVHAGVGDRQPDQIVLAGADRVVGHRAAVGRAPERHGRHAVLLAALDRELVGAERRQLPETVVAVHHDLPAVILDHLHVRPWVDLAGFYADIGRHADHAVRVDPPQIGLDEVMGDDPGVIGRHVDSGEVPATRAVSFRVDQSRHDIPPSFDRETHAEPR